MTKLIIPIEPKPQKRPRFSKFGTYEDPKMKTWRKQVTGWIEQNYDGEFFDDAVRVDVTFYLKAPQSVAKKPTPRAKAKTWEKFRNFLKELIWHTKKPDMDNLIKAAFDSITDAGYSKTDKKGIVWKDDSIVCDLHARKLYSPNPRIEIEIMGIVDEQR